MGRGENNLLYGDFFTEEIAVVDNNKNTNKNTKEGISTNNVEPLIYRQLIREGLDPIIPENEINYKHVLTRKDILFEEDGVFAGIDNVYDPSKQRSLNNNPMFPEYSGNHRIYFKKKEIPNWLLTHETTDEGNRLYHSTVKEVADNYREFYDLMKGIENPSSTGIHTTASRMYFEESLNPKEDRRRGSPIRVSDSAGMCGWVYSSEIALMEKLFDNKGIWRTKRVYNSRNLREGYPFITYIVNEDVKGIIKPQADHYELKAA